MQSTSCPIAVIGVGCRYPGARDPVQLWENILSRRREFRRMPDVRLPLSVYHDADPSVPDKTYGERAALLDGFEFDFAARRIPQATVASTDIVHWLALEVALSALADAGYERSTVPLDKTGVVVGNTLTGEHTRSTAMRVRWPFVEKALRVAGLHHSMAEHDLDALARTMERAYKSVFAPVTEDMLAGGLSNTIAGRICNYLNLHGGGYTVDGACSSSLIAVATAASSLANRSLDLAIAGGVDVSLDTFELIGFAKTGALTRDEMRVYDRRGSGFIPGEGCGFVVLQRLEDAERERKEVLAVLHGWGISSDGKGGLTAPSSEGQAEALRRAYSGAPYGIKDLTFIEGHGTGTRVGDKTELEGIARAAGGTAALRSIGMTSFKSIVGHTKAAAGVGGFIKAVLSVNRRVAPPTAGCEDPNPVFASSATELYPILHGTAYPHDHKLRAGVSAMGFGGINCHVTVESPDRTADRFAPAIPEQTLLHSHQQTEVFLLSAGSLRGLRERIADLERTAAGMSIAELVDLSAELVRTLQHQPYRASIVAASPSELVGRLRELTGMVEQPLVEGEVRVHPQREIWVSAYARKNRVGFLFPGQGSQQLNMARTLHGRHQWASTLVLAADQWLEQIGGPALQQSMFRNAERAKDAGEAERWMQELTATAIAQPAICLASLLWLRKLERLAVRPAAVAGHSLGELTAFRAAGALSDETLLKLAARRGQAMTASAGQPGTMASLSCDAPRAADLCREVGLGVCIANLNAPNQVVVSGTVESVERVVSCAAAAGIGARRLPVSNAFHSPLVEAAADAVRSFPHVLTTFAPANVKLFSTVTGAQLTSSLELARWFGDQIVAPVDFVGAVRAMAPHVDLLIEVGPGRVLSGLARSILEPQQLECLPLEARAEGDRDFNVAMAALHSHGANLQWSAMFEDRLVRAFTPATQKLFIDNPCERPMAIEGRGGVVDNISASGPPLLGRTPVSSAAASANGHASVPANASEALGVNGIGPSSATVGSLVKASAMLPAEAAQVSTGALPVLAASVAAGPSSSAVPSSPSVITRRLVQMVAERTGFSASALSPSARLLDDLNLDSIKAGELVGAAAQEMGVAGALDPIRFTNATLEEIAAAISAAMPGTTPVDSASTTTTAPPVEPADRLLPRLFELISTRSGFPIGSLNPSLRLLDDLNLDSIKAGDLVASFSKMMGVEGRLDPLALANASLQEIADAVGAVVEHSPVARPAQASGATHDAALSATLAAARALLGYAPDPDAPVAAELKLDRDKLWLVVKQVAGVLGVEPSVDLEPLSGRSLRQISAVLQGMQRRSVKSSTPGVTERGLEHAERWVRQFVLRLEESPVSSSSGVRVRTEDDWTNATVLICHDSPEQDFVDSLKAVLSARGATVRLRLFNEPASQQQLVGFTHAVAVLPSRPVGDVIERLQGSARRLAFMAQLPRAADAPQRRTTVAFVQFGGGVFGANGSSAWDACSATAFAASLHLERSDLRVRVIDLASGSDPVAQAARVVDELITPEAWVAAGFDAHLTRRVRRPHLVQPSDAVPVRRPWGRDDVVLITGGARGITAECALALARASGAAVALVGTSQPGAGSQSGAEVTQTLEKFGAEKLRCRYYAADVTNLAEVEKLVARVASELGPITGFIHGAGVNHPRRAEQVVVERAVAECSPKVLGAVHLLRALEGQPLRQIIGLTSIIGVTGMMGNAWYGFSNEALDHILRSYGASHPECDVQSLAYSVWDEVGMGARMNSVANLAAMGTAAIPPVEGIAHFLHVVAHRAPEHQVVVTSRLNGLDTWAREQPSFDPRVRALKKVITFEPGVELVTEVKLELQSDPYLADHVFKGSHLLPTVFGLELMAQLVAAVAGRTALFPLRMQNIKLERPIVADVASGARIRPWAIVDPMTTTGGALTVRAGITTEQTGFRIHHFRANFVIDAAIPREPLALKRAADPLDLMPRRDLYGSLLFQGPLFQRLETVHQLDSASAVFEALESGTDHGVLPDPYFRDALLQAGQPIIPKDLCLPVHIDAWDIFPERSDGERRRLCQAILHEKTGDTWRASVVATDGEGQVLQRLSGYRLRVLERREDNPSAEEIAAPALRDERVLHRALEEVLRAMPGDPPALVVDHIRGIHGLDRNARHERERTLFARALSAMGANELMVAWDDSGRPVLDGRPDLHLSLTHEDDLCIAAVCRRAVGVDLASASTRTLDEWQALFGKTYAPLLTRAIARGEPLERVGPQLWAALEAVTKVLGSPPERMETARNEGEVVWFEASLGSAVARAVSIPIQFTRGARKFFAVSLDAPQDEDGAKSQAQEATSAAVFDYGESIYRLNAEGGRILTARWPLTFKDVAGAGRVVRFPMYAQWMGKLREMGLSPIAAALGTNFQGSEWGLVTNNSNVEILGDAELGDVVEGRCWVSDVSGRMRSIIETQFEWRAMRRDQPPVRIARATMKTTWVRILRHGVVEPHELPPVLRSLIDRMHVSYEVEALPEPLKAMELGAEVLVAAPSLRGGPYASEYATETSQEDSNAVGNVYYASYYGWQARALDRLFHRLHPAMFRSGHEGEVVTLRASVDHLREAMPFDRVGCALRLSAVHTCGARFDAEYFRIDDDGSRVKLAVGKQDVVFVRRSTDHHRACVPTTWPAVVSEALQKLVREQRAAGDSASASL